MHLSDEPFLFGVHTLNNPHVGTFDRALSKNSDSDNITFSVRFGTVSIETVVSRFYKEEDGTIIDCFHKTSAPISLITIKDESMGALYVFDFENGTQNIKIDARENGKCYQTWQKQIDEIKNDPNRYWPHRKRFLNSTDEQRVKQIGNYFSFKFKELIEIEIPLYETYHKGLLYPTLLDGALQNFINVDMEKCDKEKSPLLYRFKEEEEKDEQTSNMIFDFLLGVLICESQAEIREFVENERIEFIEAHSVTHSMVYNISDKNDYMAQTILTYLNENIKAEDPEKEFIEDWMMKFDIGEDFEIESIGGECYKMGIIEDVDYPENITPLLDKGVGSNQVMILLLQLATIMHKNRDASIPPVVIIEEPEQNLHPKLQSCLADLFKEVHLYPQRKNPKSRGISFLIETHSEYLVRKSQVLVAKRKYEEENPFAVFYMEAGKEPRQIRYQDDGVFYDDFGDGFYDEAISLTEEIV
ncbi:MAG: ATP-binding protein [Bacteroidaceae bacterium]|nr:ATP-binding protein [Bacteroidaceae bacterium]